MSFEVVGCQLRVYMRRSVIFISAPSPHNFNANTESGSTIRSARCATLCSTSSSMSSRNFLMYAAFFWARFSPSKSSYSPPNDMSTSVSSPVCRFRAGSSTGSAFSACSATPPSGARPLERSEMRLGGASSSFFLFEAGADFCTLGRLATSTGTSNFDSCSRFLRMRSSRSRSYSVMSILTPLNFFCCVFETPFKLFFFSPRGCSNENSEGGACL
mmetsp:Transcript_1752/g.5323  ORF Transcript_1752/g.5323 Transcript_1752/m.5323 type:complete len:215 (-) Transcript_1752:58-702(-)